MKGQLNIFKYSPYGQEGGIMTVGFLVRMLKPNVRVIIKDPECKVIHDTTAGALVDVLESVDDWYFSGWRMIVIKIKGVAD